MDRLRRKPISERSEPIGTNKKHTNKTNFNNLPLISDEIISNFFFSIICENCARTMLDVCKSFIVYTIVLPSDYI